MVTDGHEMVVARGYRGARARAGVLGAIGIGEDPSAKVGLRAGKRHRGDPAAAAGDQGRDGAERRDHEPTADVVDVGRHRRDDERSPVDIHRASGRHIQYDSAAMSRGKEGDPRRGKKGGRYTPPARNRTPDQPVPIRVAVGPALTVNNQALTATSNSRDIPPREQLPQEDQAFLREVSATFGTIESTTTPEGQNPKENGFHAAVSEVNDYILALRAKLDGGLKEPDHSDIGNAWAKAEPTRPSVKRVQHLAYNFFNLPGIKKTSLGIHAQKLEAGLPHFCGVIADSIPPSSDLSGHFFEVTRLMENSLTISLDKAKLDQYLKLGMIMGYRTAGMRWPVASALRHVAGQGVGTFVEQLESVVRGAIVDRVDPSERVRTEFLDREGTVYRLMRVSFDRVNEAVKDIKGRCIEDVRRILAEKDYSTGACPALLPVDSVVEAQARAKRPIAYEYAITILRHIPPRLLQSGI